MKTNLDQMFKTDSNLELEGVVFRINDAISFRVRAFTGSNPRIKAAQAAHFKPYARQMELGTLDQKKTDELAMKTFIDVCLVSWEGIEFDGQPVECTKENALELFKRLPKMFETLWSHANDFNNFREDLGNS